MTTKERKRAPNFSAEEKLTLIEIAVSYKEIIENKKTDGVSVRSKLKAWNEIASDFNSNSMVHRTVAQLHVCYDNIKHDTKKHHFEEKVRFSCTVFQNFVDDYQCVILFVFFISAKRI